MRLGSSRPDSRKSGKADKPLPIKPAITMASKFECVAIVVHAFSYLGQILFRPARHKEDGDDHAGGKRERGSEAAQMQSTVSDRFGQGVAEGGAEWPGEDEGAPEKSDVRDVGEEVKRRD